MPYIQSGLLHSQLTLGCYYVYYLRKLCCECMCEHSHLIILQNSSFVLKSANSLGGILQTTKVYYIVHTWVLSIVQT